MDIRERRTNAYGIELRGEAADRYTHARINERRSREQALRAAVGAADGADELLQELATIAETLRAEDREPTRRERGRLRYIFGKTQELTAGLGGDDEDGLESRGRLGFDPRAAAASAAADDRTLGAWLADEMRALVEGAGSGSFIVPDDYRPEVWDRLAASSVLLSTGVRVIETTSDTLRIPRLTADVTAAAVGEGQVIAPTDPTLDEIVATPRKYASLTVSSNELLSDSNPAVVDVLAGNHLRQLALKIDLDAFEGSGVAPVIRGLKSVVGIQGAAAGTDGAVPANLDLWADAIGMLAAENATATAIVMHPRTWQGLSKIKEVSGSTKPVLTESAGAPTGGIDRRIYGVPVFLSSQLSITEAEGTSGNVCSSSYVYDASQVVFVRRAEPRVEVDRSRLFNSDQAEIRTITRIDLIVPNPKSVYRIRGLKAA